jgi:hypothetical protein
VHQLLQRMAEAGVPVLRSTGRTLWALAQKQ